MSNIYIQEPPTRGKVLLRTTVGEIEIELWSKECPKTCRNFVQLCMEGYYDGTIFHRVVKDFIAQGGDPTGTGQGGESIYGQPFKDEFHSRLRYTRRGLVGMANAAVDDNGSQFFFTLAACPELNKKNTLFGKVAGNTIYNMIKLNECEVIDERPIRTERIISTEVISNPFDDIKPRNLRAAVKPKNEDEKSAKITKGVKNFHLLSFGEEAEDEEQELESVVKEFKSKAKSAHDIGDPTLLSKPADEKKDAESGESEKEEEEETIQASKPLDIENIKSKLKKQTTTTKDKERKEPVDKEEKERERKREEIRQLEKELTDKKKKAEKAEEEAIEKQKEKKEQVEVVQKYKDDVQKYEHLKKTKKASKEDKTLEMLNSFREKLFKVKKVEDEEEGEGESEESKETSVKSDKAEVAGLKSILTHRLQVDDEIKQKVIDANMADTERFDIYDPRNPINKRKREESRGSMKDKKRTR